jgi:hypothetical protein
VTLIPITPRLGNELIEDHVGSIGVLSFILACYAFERFRRVLVLQNMEVMSGDELQQAWDVIGP